MSMFGAERTDDVVRVMVCGSRSWGGFDPRGGKTWKPGSLTAFLEAKALLAMLDGLYTDHLANARTMQLVHGACPTGADAIAQSWAEADPRIPAPERFPADWDTFGRSAGPIRNKRMVSTLDPERGDYVIAAWNGSSRGTGHAVDTARKAGLHVIEVRVQLPVGQS